MSHRDIPVYEGTPTLTADKVATIKEWLAEAMGNEDVATDPEDNCYYEGQAHMLDAVLCLLYGVIDDATADESEKLVVGTPPHLDNLCTCTEHETCDSCIDASV